MKCPLLTSAMLTTQTPYNDDRSACLQTECAWWDEDKNVCSIKVIAKELSAIQIKMPFVGQFTKYWTEA